MKKLIAVAVALSLASVALASFAGCGTPSVKIGVIAELTGSMPAVGTSCRNAVEMGTEEINAAGGVQIAGKKYKLELVVKDDKADPKAAATTARELIEEDVVAIVGPNSTGGAVPAAAEAEKSKVVLVSPWSTGSQTTLTVGGKPKTSVWRMCVTVSYEGEQMARFARDNLGAGKAAMLYDDTAEVLKNQAQDFSKSFESLGGAVVASEAFKPQDGSAAGQLDRIKAANPEVLFLNAYYGEVPAILKQVKAHGITAQIIGSDAWSSPDIIKQAGADIEGSYVFNMYSPESTDPMSRRFVKAYEKKYNSTPDDVAALSYDALGFIKKGLEGADGASREALDKSLLKIRDFKGVTGSMHFPANSGDPQRGAVMLKVEDGKFVLYAQLYAKPSKEDVVSFVNEALEYAKKNGKEKALAEFNNPDGAFNRGELYIYAYDFNGVNIAHGGNKAYIGQNLIDQRDPNGVMVIQELIERAKQGNGWLYYMWDNPQTKKVEPKVGYVVKVNDDWWLGSGIYTQ